MTKGLYIHIPFCLKKCNYCDFYSGAFSSETRQRFVEKLNDEIVKWGGINTCPIDTIYFGGGTPSLLTPKELSQITSTIFRSFTVLPNAEITFEVNPDDNGDILLSAVENGFNRFSVGIQSANEDELKILGRRHSFADAVNTIEMIKKLGVDNISADLMMGLPNSDIHSLKTSLDALISLDIPHLSSYILKIEKNTPLEKSDISLPSDDAVSDQYLFASEYLTERGYCHYEISNFAKDGFQSRHNNKYWKCEEYIGIGPSAHSFYDTRRLYYPRDIGAFIQNPSCIDDGEGGGREEYLMLALRLSRGLVFDEYEQKYGKLNPTVIKRAEKLHGLCITDKHGIRLTSQGFLLSNSIITNLLEVL